MEQVSKEQEILQKHPKFWIYSGQIVTSENAGQFSKDQRAFWTKAHQAFMKRKFYFMFGGQQFVTPFRLADGSFDSVQAVEVNNKHVEDLKAKIELEKQQVENEQVGGTIND